MLTNPAATAFSHQAWEYECPLPGGIVVGLDGSPESIAALNTGAAIARRKNLVLHSAIVRPQFPADPVEGLMKLIDSADESWTHEVIFGTPAERLAEVADRRGAELIVVGRHAHGVVDRVLGRETTLRLMRRATTPVLALDREIVKPRIGVAAIDFSASSIVAAKELLSLLVPPATLYLAYAEPPADVLPAGFAAAPDYRFTGSIVTWFRRITDSLGGRDGILIQPCVLSGRTIPCLLQYTVQVAADIVSAGSHGHNRIERFLLGSVSTGLVKDARCAVLIAPAKDIASLGENYRAD